MSTKIYVGNLPFSYTQKELTELFSSYGEISEAVVISDKFSGRSKGFGFVTFAEKADADKAIAEVNGKEIDGRKLTVNEARPMEPREEGERPRRSSGGFNRRPRY